MHTHVYTHIDMRTSHMHELTYIKCTWINTCIYRYRRTYIQTNKHTYISNTDPTYKHTYIYPSVCQSVRPYIHSHTHTYIHTNTHTYIHTHIDLLKTHIHKITKSKAINQTRQINFRETYVPKYVLQKQLFFGKMKSNNQRNWQQP